MSEIVYIGLGSNLGDRERNLGWAAAALSRIDAAAVLSCSSLYDSAPVGPPQPRYLNAVVELECALSPQRLLTILKQIETDLGRTPAGRWAPRTVDLDILLWEGRVVADVNLQIPHLELHKRRFALEPLCELAPAAHHPLLGASVGELLAALGPQDVVRIDTALRPMDGG
ncbi:MAG: 2-amino-4-hydroxy-6-hydroxymethyldihydropteridine diphosphokinase [Myxococcota bacterium]